MKVIGNGNGAGRRQTDRNIRHNNWSPQRDTLAPMLFIHVDYVLSNSEQKYGFVFNLRNTKRHPAGKINDLDFAHDIALLENFILLANEQLAKLTEAAAEVGLEINADPTEFMTLNINDAEGSICQGKNIIKKVTDFRYLGSMMESSTSDFNRRFGS